MTRFKSEEYKNFKIDFWKDAWGEFLVTIHAYRNKGTRRQEYFQDTLDSAGKTKGEAFNNAKKYIDDLIRNVKIEFRSSGLSKADYLPE